MNEQYLSKDFYHVADRPYTLGELKPPGTYGQSIEADELMTPQDDPLGEYLREKIRKEFYPEKPSRFKSVFVFETQVDAEVYRAQCQKKGAIYRVKFTDQHVTFHQVCWSAFSMTYGAPPEHQAHEFWAKPPVYKSNSEIFAESAIEFIEEVAPALG